MEYVAVYKAKADSNRNFDISYSIFKEGNSYGIESFVCGGRFHEKVCIGNFKENKVKQLALFFAEKGVHPLHIEDIISDMRF